MPLTVLVLGGYGNFGSKMAQRLAPCDDISLIIAGRSLAKAQALAERLQHKAANPVRAQALDINSDSFDRQLATSGAQLLIHTSGPFQSQAYHVAQTCIAQGIHYIDLADGREFVAGFHTLDQEAQQKNVIAISGASTVPGLSSAVIDHYLPQFAALEQVDYGISPGNRAERGEATVTAILSYTGHSFPRLELGLEQAVYGWQDNHLHRFPAPMGSRWLANCDIPDLSLFPQCYPSLQTIRFYAGLELPVLHLAMASMSWLARMGIVKNWGKYAAPITRLSRWFERFGSDVGGMYMKLSGIDHAGSPKTIVWTLLAERGDGPWIPTIPAVILAKKIARNGFRNAGARSCIELFTVEEFFDEVKDLAIYPVTQGD